jgi:1-deoxy-D-xylulose-5-phosphate synthase
VTQKGRGYGPAEKAPVAFHGPGPFEVSSGQMVKSAGAPSYSQVFSETLRAIARQRPDVVAITAAMPDGTKLDAFAQEFPQRCFDVGIAEQHAATFAAGLALGGLRPVFAVYSTFLQRAYDQVVHDVCHQDLPVIFAVDRAGLVGADGATHQGIYDLSFLRAIPNIEIAMGKDEDELRSLLAGAFDRPHPVAIRYPRGSGKGVDLSAPIRPIEWGTGEWLRRGQDCTIVALGPITYTALEVAERLGEQGFSLGVVNARFVKPLDVSLLRQVVATSRTLVTIEEHARAGGFGSAVGEWLAAEGIQKPFRLYGLPDEFIDHGPREYYLDAYGLSPDALAADLQRWLQRAVSLPSSGTTTGEWA